jgi:3-ketosteroid 9alpha-monooxygenase subunit A
MSRFPFPATPNGWYQVAFARTLAVGDVLPLRYFGRDLVLFRGEDGEARVFDAYCPHLGAHLGFGGRVRGAGIQCPFHGWRFDGEGRCVAVPGLERKPPAAEVRRYPVAERNGIVFAWHHAGGAAPDWQVPVWREDDADWTEWSSSAYSVRTHVQDMAENILDRAHFLNVHDMEEPHEPRFDVRFEGPFMAVEQTMRMRSGPSAGVEILAKTTNCGPGMSAVRVDVGPIQTLALVTHTPLDDEQVALQLSFCMKRIPDAAAMARIEAMNREIVNAQFRQDIPIWEHKMYRDRPLLTAADGPIVQYRRWYRQFYAEAAA